MKNNLVDCIPVLQTNDALKSIEFYCNVLGFTKNWQHQFEADLPLFASIGCEGKTVFLTEHANESAFGAEIYFFVKDINQLADNIKRRGAVLEIEPHDTPYGTREITINDPDGNTLRIGQHID